MIRVVCSELDSRLRENDEVGFALESSSWYVPRTG